MPDIFELRQEEFHRYWPFIKQGLDDVKRKIKPNWIAEDMYAALRAGQVNCVLGRINGRLMGYIIFGRQLRPFSFAPELFVWVYWCLPLRDWPDQEDMLQLGRDAWAWLANVAKTQYGTDQITWVTTPKRAQGFERRWGYQPTWVTMTVKV